MLERIAFTHARKCAAVSAQDIQMTRETALDLVALSCDRSIRTCTISPQPCLGAKTRDTGSFHLVPCQSRSMESRRYRKFVPVWSAELSAQVFREAINSDDRQDLQKKQNQKQLLPPLTCVGSNSVESSRRIWRGDVKKGDAAA